MPYLIVGCCARCHGLSVKAPLLVGTARTQVPYNITRAGPALTRQANKTNEHPKNQKVQAHP